MKNILITGGTGYIGSHTCLLLLEKGYKLTIVDSNVNSSPLSIDRVKKLVKNKFVQNKISFFKGDLRDKLFLSRVFIEAIEGAKDFIIVCTLLGMEHVFYCSC